jgi:hypothetical protein
MTNDLTYTHTCIQMANDLTYTHTCIQMTKDLTYTHTCIQMANDLTTIITETSPDTFHRHIHTYTHTYMHTDGQQSQIYHHGNLTKHVPQSY